MGVMSVNLFVVVLHPPNIQGHIKTGTDLFINAERQTSINFVIYWFDLLGFFDTGLHSPHLIMSGRLGVNIDS